MHHFTKLAQSERCCFIGNIGLGKDVTLAQLQPFYNAVVLVSTKLQNVLIRSNIMISFLASVYQKAYGVQDDKLLGIPGEVYT